MSDILRDFLIAVPLTAGLIVLIIVLVIGIVDACDKWAEAVMTTPKDKDE